MSFETSIATGSQTGPTGAAIRAQGADWRKIRS
jgi:hypothetical protein